MKKADAEDKLAKAGFTINNLNMSAWNTALHPTRYGWGSSLLSIASIPVLSAASLGHMVAAAVTSQVSDDTFEKITTLGGDKPDRSAPPAPPADPTGKKS
jgi:hypothetical protein